MTVKSARSWLISCSLIITGVQSAFLVMAPAFGYPLSSPQNLHMLQIIGPVFLGYLASATHFIFQDPVPQVPVQRDYLGLLIVGPLLIYILVVGGTFVAFGYSNRASAKPDEGISVDDLAMSLSIALGLLAATIGVINSYLFVAPQKLQNIQQGQHGIPLAQQEPPRDLLAVQSKQLGE